VRGRALVLRQGMAEAVTGILTDAGVAKERILTNF
jgi:hypothetical protein